MPFKVEQAAQSARLYIDSDTLESWGSLTATTSTSLHDFILPKEDWLTDALLPQSWDRVKYKSLILEQLNCFMRAALETMYLPFASITFPMNVAFSGPFSDDPRVHQLISRWRESSSFVDKANIESRSLLEARLLGVSRESFASDLLDDVTRSLQQAGERPSLERHLKHFISPAYREERLLELPESVLENEVTPYCSEERRSSAISYLREVAETLYVVCRSSKSPALQKRVSAFLRDFGGMTEPELIPVFLRLASRVMADTSFFVSRWDHAFLEATKAEGKSLDSKRYNPWATMPTFLSLTAWGIFAEVARDLGEGRKPDISAVNLKRMLQTLETSLPKLDKRSRHYMIRAYGFGIAALHLHGESVENRVAQMMERSVDQCSRQELRTFAGAVVASLNEEQVRPFVPLLGATLKDLNTHPEGIHELPLNEFTFLRELLSTEDIKIALEHSESWTDRDALITLLCGRGEVDYLLSHVVAFEDESRDLSTEEYQVLLKILLQEAQQGDVHTVLPALFHHIQATKHTRQINQIVDTRERLMDVILLRTLYHFGVTFPDAFREIGRASGFVESRGVLNWLQTLHDEENIYLSTAILSWVGEPVESFIGALTQTDNPFVVAVLCATIAERWGELSIHDNARISFMLSRVVQRTVHPGHQSLLSGWAEYFGNHQLVVSTLITAEPILHGCSSATNTVSMLLDFVRVVGSADERRQLHHLILNGQNKDRSMVLKRIKTLSAWFRFEHELQRKNAYSLSSSERSL